MSLTTTTPATTTTEGWAEVAAELHRIADALATLGPDMPEPHCGLTLSSRTDGGVDDAKRMAAVDAISLAVLGESGELDAVGTSVHPGKRRYGPRRSLINPIYLSIFDTVTDPAHVSEVERLRAELAELRAERNRADDAGAECTHGGDCTLHPNVQALHNFDNAPDLAR